MNKSKIGIIILLLLLAVGFATVTANLIINNNANISAKPDDFNVFFSNAITEDDSSAVISADKKTITYSTRQLVNPGDKSELLYTVTNESSQYDAEIDMSISFDSAYASYLKITYETFDNTNKTVVDAKSDKDGKITIELLKPVIEDIPIVITITYNANALERSSIAHGIYTVRFNNTGATSGDISTQDIVPGTNTSLLSNQLLRTGYTLAGWSTIENDTKVELFDEEEVLNLTNRGNTIDLYPVWVKTTDNYSYTGNYQEFTAPLDGIYNIQLWGAQGNGDNSYPGGYGGYTSGNIVLNKDDKLYLYVGEMPSGREGGYNGGMGACYGDRRSSTYQNTNGGGGATDIRYFASEPQSEDLVWDSAIGLKNRIMVAAGGGGAYSFNTQYTKQAGGNAGGLTSYPTSGAYKSTTGATQTTPGVNNNPQSFGNYGTVNGVGAFGVGGSNEMTIICIDGRGTCHTVCGGAGSGYYGGAAGIDYGTPGGGGSSFISGHDGCDAIDSSGSHTGQPNHFSGKYFTNTVMIDGAGYNWTNTKGLLVNQTQPDGSTSAGHSGNGYARITFISAIKES